MANHKSAEKRNKQNLKANERNKAYKSAMKTAIKKFKTVLEAQDKEAINSSFTKVQQTIAKTAQKGLIHKKTGSRYISRLNALKNK